MRKNMMVENSNYPIELPRGIYNTNAAEIMFASESLAIK